VPAEPWLSRWCRSARPRRWGCAGGLLTSLRGQRREILLARLKHCHFLTCCALKIHPEPQHGNYDSRHAGRDVLGNLGALSFPKIPSDPGFASCGRIIADPALAEPAWCGAGRSAGNVLQWHRAGFMAFWRWKSRNRIGRPKIDRELRDLIRRMSQENPSWGASRIHGELLMLGLEAAQSAVSKYMVQGGSPSQSWKTFLRNHAQAIAGIDLCVVPTLTFERLFAFLVLDHGRRQLLWFEVTRQPTAEWLARQITEAFPWASAPVCLVRDNDRAYGHVFKFRVRAMGIRDRPISPGSPWQNPYVERLIGTVRRECLDRMLIFGEAHLRQTLSSYAAYYNEARTHLALGKDAPLGRAVQRSGTIVAIPILSGLHHHHCARGRRHAYRHKSPIARSS
jgi:transposase InsO family protein